MATPSFVAPDDIVSGYTTHGYDSCVAHGTFVVLVALLGCSASAPEPQAPAETPAVVAPAPALASCGTADVAELDDYFKIEVPGTYWVEMYFDGERDAWKQARSIRVPPQHSTRLRLTNIGHYPQLESNRDARVRLTIDVAERELGKVPGGERFLVTYSAKVLQVCALGKR